ncbi:transcriptional regulator with GAF, ATPase, and Fis domain [Arthrobacter sp. 1088]|uniref:GAF and ANTAR domain-containing protein n=1 Tax=Arthrobacter sp. 1088 TaxID=2817768 RepID=UPI0028565060|nr:GAF and ANTAR domain-containing protein [Arthrobacter sp. 1088]MDR6685403.1 transcriptional regulator with GAF, ATPase, and Fis domain [Arthrobacter sp. 1088]
MTGTADIKTVLQGVTAFAARALTKAAGVPIDCALTLRRRKRTATVAGSSDKAVLLDRIEQKLGKGPCVDALNVGTPMLLDDVTTDASWPEYSLVLAEAGCQSALGVPMDLGETSEAVLNFFASEPGLFTPEVVDEAAAFADIAGSTLRLAIRIENLEQLNTDLKTAMGTRTVIDLACGAIMSQNHCTQEEAFAMLTSASSHRNEKLHTVAATIVTNLSGQAATTAHFED